MPGLIIGSELSWRRKRWHNKDYSFWKKRILVPSCYVNSFISSKQNCNWCKETQVFWQSLWEEDCAHTLTIKQQRKRFILETLQRNPPHKQAQKISSSLICQGTWKYWLNHIIQSINFHGTKKQQAVCPLGDAIRLKAKQTEFRPADFSGVSREADKIEKDVM